MIVVQSYQASYLREGTRTILDSNCAVLLCILCLAISLRYHGSRCDLQSTRVGEVEHVMTTESNCENPLSIPEDEWKKLQSRCNGPHRGLVEVHSEHSVGAGRLYMIPSTLHSTSSLMSKSQDPDLISMHINLYFSSRGDQIISKCVGI